MLVQQIEDIFPLEWCSPAEQGVQHASQRVQVAAARGRLALGLFRRQVLGGADDRPGAGQVLGGEDVSDAEIGQANAAIAAAQQVRGFEVAMDDAVIVGVFQRGTDLNGHRQHFRPRQPALLFQQVGEVMADHIFHDVIQQFAMRARLVKVDDVGVLQGSQHVDFTLEAADGAAVRGQLAGQHLDGGQALRLPDIMGQIHLPHAAVTQLAIQAFSGMLCCVLNS